MTNLEVQVCAERHEVGYEPRCRPDSCWSWLVCASSLISVVIVAGICYSFGILLPPMMENFEATRQETAWIGAMYTGCGYLLSPLGSYINHRFSYRFTAILGSLSGIIGFFLASFSSELWIMYLTIGVLSGFGHVMIVNTSYLVILQYFVKWRSLAVGIVASGPAIGLLAMTQVTQALLTTFGLQGPLRGFAFLFFVCGLCVTVFVPLNQLKEKSNDRTSLGTSQKESRTLSLFRNRPFLIMLTSFIIVHLSYFVPTIHIVKHCMQELHMSENKASMLYTYMAITSFISRHLFCKLGDYRYFNRFYLYQGGMTVSGLCILCLPAARSFVAIATLFMGFGLMDGAMLGQLPLLVLECVGKNKVNQAWGYTMFFSGVSVSIGPPMVGLMADKLGSYTASFYAAGAITIVGASITSLMAFVKRQPEESDETQSYDEELLVTEKLTVL